MKVALISDIHGNLEALTAVLQHIGQQGTDEIFCLGDVIGYGCDPGACLELIDSHASVKLMGNHEYAALGKLSVEAYTPAARESSSWTREKLTDRELDLIAGYQMRRDFDDGTLVHASPFEMERWHYVFDPHDARMAFESFSGCFCFHGHSHIPMIFRKAPGQDARRQAGHDIHPSEEDRYLINVGSVGQPRDHDPRACYVTFDTKERYVSYHRVEYDIESTQAKMIDARLPELLVNRLAVGQ